MPRRVQPRGCRKCPRGRAPSAQASRDVGAADASITGQVTADLAPPAEDHVVGRSVGRDAERTQCRRCDENTGAPRAAVMLAGRRPPIITHDEPCCDTGASRRTPQVLVGIESIFEIVRRSGLPATESHHLCRGRAPVVREPPDLRTARAVSLPINVAACGRNVFAKSPASTRRRWQRSCRRANCRVGRMPCRRR